MHVFDAADYRCGRFDPHNLQPRWTAAHAAPDRWSSAAAPEPSRPRHAVAAETSWVPTGAAEGVPHLAALSTALSARAPRRGVGPKAPMNRARRLFDF
jgi:hypothetical protein